MEKVQSSLHGNLQCKICACLLIPLGTWFSYVLIESDERGISRIWPIPARWQALGGAGGNGMQMQLLCLGVACRSWCRRAATGRAMRWESTHAACGEAQWWCICMQCKRTTERPGLKQAAARKMHAAAKPAGSVVSSCMRAQAFRPLKGPGRDYCRLTRLETQNKCPSNWRQRRAIRSINGAGGGFLSSFSCGKCQSEQRSVSAMKPHTQRDTVHANPVASMRCCKRITRLRIGSNWSAASTVPAPSQPDT